MRRIALILMLCAGAACGTALAETATTESDPPAATAAPSVSQESSTEAPGDAPETDEEPTADEPSDEATTPGSDGATLACPGPSDSEGDDAPPTSGVDPPAGARTTVVPAPADPAPAAGSCPVEVTEVLAFTETFRPSPLAPIEPGATATSVGELIVTAPGAWTLSVGQGGPATEHPGHVRRSGCEVGVEFFAKPLAVTASPDSGSSPGARALSAGTTPVASGGKGTTRVRLDYVQEIGAQEAVAIGCDYVADVTYTLS